MSRCVWSVDPMLWSYTTATAMAFAQPLFADAYTDAIKGEAYRIDSGPTVTTTAPKGAGSISQGPLATPFERELDQRYHGTYLFYKQLSGPSQEEILQAHANGASMAEIREKVMDGFLLRR